LSPFYYEALTRFHSLSPQDGKEETCRPFDEARNGAVAGEGCGILCLESRETARARGAKIYCEILGTGLGSSPTTPTGWPEESSGIKRTIQRALKNAGVTPDTIGAISAAANGGIVLDKVEAEAYSELFSRQTAITSLKGAIGESFSGGGIRACALALSMGKGIWPQTAGLAHPLTPLGFVRGENKVMNIKQTLLTGISSGGTYACVVFGTDGNEGEIN
jgi:3-oxoacyl-[acyl-carrier-protein] synthase II